MIAATGSIEFAHARISARYGMRADASTWQRLEPIRAWPAFIDATRKSLLGRWTSTLSAHSDSHHIEHALREQWRREVTEVATWMPGEWQDAVLWWATWVDVPVLEYLARGEPALPWMAHDALYRQLTNAEARTAETGATTIGDTERAHRFLPALRKLASHPGSCLSRWCDAWHALLPAGQAGALLQLELHRVLHRHLANFSLPGLRDGWPLRRVLDKRLVALFRRAPLEPVTAFIYLARTALDLERLRGELVRRALFAVQPGPLARP